MNKHSKLIRTQVPQTQFREHSTPLYLTSSFTFDDAEQARSLFADEIDGNIYSRFSNPNVTEFINKMCSLEGAEDGFAFATGMAAVFSSMAALLKTGDHVLASRSLFGSTHQIFTKIFPKWGIQYSYVNSSDVDNWEKEIKSNTKMIYIESPSNPGLELIDLQKVAALKNKYDLILNVDNCFATPILQNPIKYGADLVSHSATKYIDGQGRVLGGIAVGKQELINEIRFFARHTGPALSPFNAWLLSKSLETLPVRMKAHCENAYYIAKKLEGNSEIDFLKYPLLESHPQFALAKKQMSAGGGILTFSLKGGYERAEKFVDAIQFLSVTANLGDTRTIVTHPASTTHSKLSDKEKELVAITPGLIRISVGLEDPDDILNDILQALKKSK